MNHVMIDLETLGTRSYSVFLSIAAIQFDPNTGKTGNVFRCNINLESATKAGLRIDSSTLEWWLTQRPEIMKRMFDDPIELKDALRQLAKFFSANKIFWPWGNSAGFDLGLLADGYGACKLPLPWKYYNEMCYRTMAKLVPSTIEKPKDAHDPIIDCEYQIKVLYHVLQTLKIKL